MHYELLMEGIAALGCDEIATLRQLNHPRTQSYGSIFLYDDQPLVMLVLPLFNC